MIIVGKKRSREIDEATSVLHSTPLTERSLCQYKDLSCTRCCLPHIGGEKSAEVVEDDPFHTVLHYYGPN